jgi:hypothetical protein
MVLHFGLVRAKIQIPKVGEAHSVMVKATGGFGVPFKYSDKLWSSSFNSGREVSKSSF